MLVLLQLERLQPHAAELEAKCAEHEAELSRAKTQFKKLRAQSDERKQVSGHAYRLGSCVHGMRTAS